MPSGKRDYYEVLGVAKDAAADAIKKAYRKLAIQLHPDRNKAKDAEDKFKELSEAYAVLSDPEKRARYDQLGHAGIDAQYSAEDLFRNVDFGDMFRGMGFEGIFGDLFGMGRGSSGGPHRGRDLQVAYNLTLEEAYEGTSADIAYWRLENCEPCKGTGAEPGSKIDTCTTCRGRGQVQRTVRTPFGNMSQVGGCPDCGGQGRRIINPCKKCKGTGHDRHKRTVTVQIPAGVETGQSLRVQGQGEVGMRGGPYGDLYVEIQVKPHTRFHREGPDLVTELPISIPQAALGTTVDQQTIDGVVQLSIPPGSETGKVLRLRGKGMPYLRGSGHGDLHVRLRVVVPTKISDRGRQLLQELSAELDGDAAVQNKKGGFFDFLRSP